VISVSPAGPGDAGAIAGLLAEMDVFYGAARPDPLDLRVRQIRDALFGRPPAGFALLAWDEGQLAGLAAYSFVWPAVGLTRSLYLKELYVSAGHRQRSVGKLLMQAIFAEAGQRGCSRVEWTTDTDNAGAGLLPPARVPHVPVEDLLPGRKLR
jgi:GNAT superfamily N-acetyltransferase